MFNEHNLDRSYLTRVAETYLRNEVMPDGAITLYSPGQTGIELWEHESEIYSVLQTGVVAKYMKVNRGPAGPAPVLQIGNIIIGDAESPVDLKFYYKRESEDGILIYALQAQFRGGPLDMAPSGEA